MTVSPDGTILATAGEDCNIAIWDLRTGACRGMFRAADDPPRRLSFSPDGRHLATPVSHLKIWDFQATLGRGRQETQLAGWGMEVLAFSPDGKRVVGSGPQGAASVFDVKKARYLRGWWKTPGPVRGAAWAPDGRLVALASGNEIGLWGRDDNTPEGTLSGAQGEILCTTFSPDGKHVLGAGDEGVVRVWDYASRRPLRVLNGVQGRIRCIGFARDGKLVAAGSDDGTIAVWSWPAGRLVQVLRPGLGSIHSLAFTASNPRANTLAALHWGTGVRLWDVNTGKSQGSIGGSAAPVPSVAVSPDGKLIASAGLDRILRLWDPKTGHLVRAFTDGVNPLHGVAFSPDSRWLACGGGIGAQTVRIYDTRTWSVRHVLRGGVLPAFTVAFSPDSRRLACGGHGLVSLYDVASGGLLHHLRGHELAVEKVVFSPDGKLLASACQDYTARLWDPDTGECLRVLNCEPGRLYDAAFSPDGKLLATVSGDNGLRLWNPATGEMLRRVEYHGRSLAFTPAGASLLCGAVGGSGDIVAFDPAAPAARRLLASLGTEPRSIAVTPDGTTLVAGRQDGAVTLLDLRPEARGRTRAILFGLPPDLSAIPGGASQGALNVEDYLVLTPELYYSGSPAADRVMRLGSGEEFFPAECFQARYYRPDLVRRSLAGEDVPPLPPLKGPRPPSVSFTGTPEGPVVPGRRVRVSLVAVDDHEVKRLLLFVNGQRVDEYGPGTANAARLIRAESKPVRGKERLIRAESKPVKAGKRLIRAESKPAGRPQSAPPNRTERFVAGVPVPDGTGPIRIQAVAYDAEGLQSTRAELLVRRDSASPRKPRGRLLGLCVGISRYQASDLRLRYAAADARSLASELSRQGPAPGGKPSLYRSCELKALCDEQATRSGILGQLDTLIASAARHDTVLLHFSGHGWRSGGEFYFAAYETDPRRIAGTALPWKSVAQRLTRLSERSRRVVVFLDACHSGSAASNEDLIRVTLAAQAGVVIFASARRGEVSLESPDLRHGLFTHALLNGLRGAAAAPGSEQVTLWDLAVYVRRRVQELSEDLQHPQLPFLQDFDTDEALVVCP